MTLGEMTMKIMITVHNDRITVHNDRILVAE